MAFTRRRFVATLLAVGPVAARAQLIGASQMTSYERIEQILRGWDAIVDHRTGTAGDRATAEWLAEEIHVAGAEPVLDPFPFERVVLHECTVAVEGRRADGVPCFDGAFTGPEGIVQPLAPIESDAGIGVVEYLPDAQSEGNRLLAAARRTHAHAAIVAVAGGRKKGAGLTPINADAYLAPYGPPVLQVATEHLGWLKEAAAAGARARLVAHATRESTTAYNVEARIQGRRPELAPLVIMTPRSGWWTCTSERGGGIVVWLELLRHFGESRPERPVLFTANTGHELGHLGMNVFLTRYPTLLRDAHTWVHLGANFAAAGGELVYQASNEAMMARGVALLTEHGRLPSYTTPVGTRPLGEARNVYDGGGRYVSLLGSNPLFHHPDDRWPHAIDMDATAAATAAMLELIDQLAGV